ncbi:hypothetical protein [Paractinoplanes toevensis]|uniref:Squalene cyclase n=1 Tax=Paractinoplanes toevensis TaxID=571911 RepID=A0A919W998_9ACTN|nr:hypothetical protein [Actinoplanes toevensis]GIM95974.1 hypothetical protein Ato02nite_077670 [Actinoplanes toevensis]
MTVQDWLLGGDPAIRWQVLGDPAVRARVTTTGWGARLLAAQDWTGGAHTPREGWDRETEPQPWTATEPTLTLLMQMGAQLPAGLVDRIATECRWENDNQPFFTGETEPCINGRVVALGVYFDRDVTPIITRLLSEQLDDGGWNCYAESGSTRSSFDTTINVLEGLRAYEKKHGATPSLTAARRRGEEYLLDRRLLRRLSTGEVVSPGYLRLSFPVRWHYDVLRALEYFAGRDDPRLDEARQLLRDKRQPDGTWLLEHTHPGKVHFRMEEEGRPSRWNTLRALRALGADAD